VPPYLAEYQAGANPDHPTFGLPSDNPAYDAWGYKPASLAKPTQHTYTTYYSKGGAAANYPAPPNSEFEQYGMTNSHLALWGNAQPYNSVAKVLQSTDDLGFYSVGPFTGDGFRASNVFPGSEYASKHKLFWAGVHRQPDVKPMTKAWLPNGPSGSKYGICVPSTYPDCDMTLLAAGDPSVGLYDGTVVTGVEDWRQGIDDAYTQAYVNGGFDALIEETNTTDTSITDPCEGPGFLVQITNSLLAVGGLALYTWLLDPELTDLISAEQRFAIAMGCLLGTYYWANSTSGDFGDPKENLFIAQQAIGIPVSWAFVDYTQQQWEVFPLQPPLPLLGGIALSYLFVGDLIGVVLDKVGFLRDLWGLASDILNIVSSFVCRITSGSYDACADNAANPKARRWDAASLAGMLVDEIRSDEGWDRDDPRAEFCYKALLSSPAFMDIGRWDPNRPPIWMTQPTNFLGSIYARDDIQALNQMLAVEGVTKPGEMLYLFGDIGGWDGARSGILDTAQYNNFACQNWELLRNANFTAAKGTNKPQVAFEARQVKYYFDEWVKRLKVAANDPTNLARANKIPGWSGELAFDPSKNNPTQLQIEYAMLWVIQAADFVERLKVLQDFMGSYRLPPEDDNHYATYFTWNLRIYRDLASNPDFSANELWESFFSKFPTETTEERDYLSLILRAVGGCLPNAIRAYWMRAPKAMYDAANAAPAPAAWINRAGFYWPYEPPEGYPLTNLIFPLKHLEGPDSQYLKDLVPLPKPVVTTPVDAHSDWAIAIRMLQAADLSERQAIASTGSGMCTYTPSTADTVSCFLAFNTEFWTNYQPGQSPAYITSWLQAQYSGVWAHTPQALQHFFSWAIWTVPYNATQREQLLEVFKLATAVGFPAPSGTPPQSYPPYGTPLLEGDFAPQETPVLTNPVDPRSHWAIALDMLEAPDLSLRFYYATRLQGWCTDPNTLICFLRYNAMFWEGCPYDQDTDTIVKWLQVQYREFYSVHPIYWVNWAIWSVPYNPQQAEQLKKIYDLAITPAIGFLPPSQVPPRNYPPCDWAYLGVDTSE